ncbi:MAG: dihydropteroate synthase [archaeon]|nr:dihydropteroate synthase [archaeon]MCP8305752.1 dihydropteroate synthase [archaeon]
MAIVSELAGVKIGDGHPVRVMGVINVSPESFYKGSIRASPDEIADLAKEIEDEGADMIDIGAMSTAPYLKTEISVEEEIRRLSMAIKIVKETVSLPISVDTTRSRSAEEAVKAGAEIINDVYGLKGDDRMARVVAEYGVGLIIAAHTTHQSEVDPIKRVTNMLDESLDLAREAGIPDDKIVIDPAIGFIRNTGWPWHVWDCYMIKNLQYLRKLGRPICIAVSRKSFIGKILDLKDPEDRLFGSLSATAVAVYNGAHIIRTHDVSATLQTVRLVEFIKRAPSTVKDDE